MDASSIYQFCYSQIAFVKCALVRYNGRMVLINIINLYILTSNLSFSHSQCGSSKLAKNLKLSLDAGLLHDLAACISCYSFRGQLC